MFCPKCGQESAAGHNFCKKCGQAFDAQTVKQVEVRNPRMGKNEQIFGAILCLVGIVLTLGWCGRALSGDAAPMSWAETFTVGLGVLSFFGGLGLYLVGRFRHWYHAE